MVCYFFSRKAGVNKGEQGESNAEGMGCTQLNFNSPVRSVHAFAVYIGFQGKKEDSTISHRINHSTVKISAPPAVM